MITLSFGVKKPQSGDGGAAFFPALEQNMQLLNDHVHDGLTSAAIPSTSIAMVSQSLSSIPWVSVGSGKYKKTVTIPGFKKYSNSFIVFRDSDGDQIFLDVEKGNLDTQYLVFSNDNTLDITAYYVS